MQSNEEILLKGKKDITMKNRNAGIISFLSFLTNSLKTIDETKVDKGKTAIPSKLNSFIPKKLI